MFSFFFKGKSKDREETKNFLVVDPIDETELPISEALKYYKEDNLSPPELPELPELPVEPRLYAILPFRYVEQNHPGAVELLPVGDVGKGDIYLEEMQHLSNNIINNIIMLPKAIKSQLMLERLVICNDILNHIIYSSPDTAPIKKRERIGHFAASTWQQTRKKYFINKNHQETDILEKQAILHPHLEKKKKDFLDVFNLSSIERDLMLLGYRFQHAKATNEKMFEDCAKGLEPDTHESWVKMGMYEGCLINLQDFFMEILPSIFDNSFLHINEHSGLRQRKRGRCDVFDCMDEYDWFEKGYKPGWDGTFSIILVGAISRLNELAILDEAGNLLVSGYPPIEEMKRLDSKFTNKRGKRKSAQQMDRRRGGNADNVDGDTKSILYPSEIIEHLNKNVIGQQQAKVALANAVFTHQTKITTSEEISLPSSNLLLIGPSGSGKTHLIHELSELIDVPHVVVDAQNFTGTGWNGKNTSDIFELLLQKAFGCLEKAQKGIVFIDEIDKLADSGTDSKYQHNTTEVQANLLKVIESSEVLLSDDMVISTENILFIFAGAFSGLDEIIKKRLRPINAAKIGFTSPAILKTAADKSTSLVGVEAEDLINYGLMPEFVGRMRSVATLEALSDNDMMDVFKTPKSVLNQYKNLFSSYGSKLKFEDDALMKVIEAGSENKLGVRGMESKIANLLQEHLVNINSKENKDIVISKDQVLK
jgi:ATP-dependent Clp protease ATP-binding subunit ClpX